MRKLEFTMVRVALALGFAALLAASHGWADEAPTILIEDAILTCTAHGQSASMPSVEATAIDQGAMERRLHRLIAQACQGETVCRIKAGALLNATLRNSPCDDVVIVPVCAIGAFGNIAPDTSPEMTLPLRDDSVLVINCSGRSNPHF